jgi:AbrB family looped-hinge helix DNA binding protein
MDAAIIRVSSKGQIVIPATWRKKMEIVTGEELLAIGDDDTLILRKISSLGKDFEKLLIPIREKIAMLGIDKEDVEEIIREVRPE